MTSRAKIAGQLAGIDEAGRGPWAGPVVAAAVILPNDFPRDLLRDSKQLSARKRGSARQILLEYPGVIYAVAVARVEEIDQLNILQATFLAMRRALQALACAPDFVQVDGRDFPFTHQSGEAVIGGDALVPEISAASILAKEARDDMMRGWAQAHPEYGFDSHKGYGTPLHHAALLRHGPCPIHRRSFAPVRLCLRPGIS